MQNFLVGGNRNNNLIIGLVVLVIIAIAVWYFYYRTKEPFTATVAHPEMEMRYPVKQEMNVPIGQQVANPPYPPRYPAQMPTNINVGPLPDDRDLEPVGVPEGMMDNAYILEGSDLCDRQ